MRLFGVIKDKHAIKEMFTNAMRIFIMAVYWFSSIEMITYNICKLFGIPVLNFSHGFPRRRHTSHTLIEPRQQHRSMLIRKLRAAFQNTIDILPHFEIKHTHQSSEIYSNAKSSKRDQQFAFDCNNKTHWSIELRQDSCVTQLPFL